MAHIINRRDFTRNSLLGALGMAVMTGRSSASVSDISPEGGIPMRELGKTGLKVSILALPGWHVGRMKEEKNAIRMIRMAVDLGINFFDSAWEYEKGVSEERLGKAFVNDRQKVFLMTKVLGRDKKVAQQQLEDSLRRMKTDYLDLWQFHALGNKEDVDKIFAPNGAYEVALKAKEEGKVRHIGLTGHRDPEVLLKAAKEYHQYIETLQMPINIIDPHYMSFTSIVAPEAVKHNLGIIAMKTCAFGQIVAKNIGTIDECLNFAWSQPISTLVSGMDHYDHLTHNVNLAKQFKKMSDKEREQLIARTKGKIGPEYERYKAGGSNMTPYPERPLL